jgi:ATP-dependent DNA helicase RecG
MDLYTPLQFVKGIGPARAEMLAGKGLNTVADLLYYAPFRYEDRRNVKPISQLAPGEKAVVFAQVTQGKLAGYRRRSLGLFEVTLRDESGATLLARWFHGERYAENLLPGVSVSLFGKVELDRGRSGALLMVQPELEIIRDEDDEDKRLREGQIVPVYEAAGKVSTRLLRKLIKRLLREVDLPGENLPPSVLGRTKLPGSAEALQRLHEPDPDSDLTTLNAFRTPAHTRLIFEEFFWLECGLALKRSKARSVAGISFDLTDRVREQLKKMLPFKPTNAQRKVIQEIADDMKQPHPMNRLLQGDVGSGKTLVAAQAAVIAVENAYQVAVLAPTEILATQHYAYFKRLLEKLGYVVVLLTGSSSGREKLQIKRLISEGLVHVVVGTHALLQEDVSYKRLGLSIIDEQHRFGVRQRLSMMQKGTEPDVLVMTATPIPRTLALTLYGDLDISVIDELPPGRYPITTRHVPDSRVEQIYSFIAQEVAKGRQAYVVYPIVEESETLVAVKAAEKMFTHLSETVFPKLRVGLLHGKLSADEKDSAMRRFARHETDILVATTVIEVGVDVPNASVMVVEQAERFGLAQIHQLRGRVGRGPHQSYCILVTGKLNELAADRIRTLVDSSDGFYIAEMDMQLRGPGEFYGTKQSGIPGLRLADLIRDSDILETARGEAQQLISREDNNAELRHVVRFIQDNWQRKYGLAKVG